MNLNQIVAIEKGIKSRTYSAISEANKVLQKPALFSGLVKTYQSKDEEGESLPSESQKVQVSAGDMLHILEENLTELFDTEATKDYGNCQVEARASVEVDGKVVVADAPVTLLLFLEKQLADVRTFIENIPTLDGTDTWLEDKGTGLYVTSPVQTHRTKKIQRPLVMYDATKEHPAQTQIITEDVIAGFWTTTKQSGALAPKDKFNMLVRVEKLSDAVKMAREKANQATVEKIHIGSAIFSYIIG